MEKVRIAGRPRLWVGMFPFCAGCQHPTVQGLFCEVITEMGLEGNTIIVGGVGCASTCTFGIDVDRFVIFAHGRACDVATGIKRALHGKPIVTTFQGDGDTIAIGAGSLISAALRGEKITVIMLNNTNYGTTGGQLAPTTLVGQVTSTTPQGRHPEWAGYPAHVPEMLVPIKGVAYTARGALNTIANYERVKRYLKTALQKQIDNVGFSFVEVLSACPVNWRLSPVESLHWIEEKVIAEFPLGEFKNVAQIE